MADLCQTLRNLTCTDYCYTNSETKTAECRCKPGFNLKNDSQTCEGKVIPVTVRWLHLLLFSYGYEPCDFLPKGSCFVKILIYVRLSVSAFAFFCPGHNFVVPGWILKLQSNLYKGRWRRTDTRILLIRLRWRSEWQFCELLIYIIDIWWCCCSCPVCNYVMI